MNSQNDAQAFLLGQLENILDLLYCANLNESKSIEPSFLSLSNKEPQKTKIAPKPSSPSPKTEEKEPEPKESVYINKKRFKSSKSLKGDGMNIPKRQVLQKHRLWEQAFKPLKVEANHSHKKIIDIAKTVDFIAQSGYKQVVFTSEKKLVYKLNLLIDKDSSMEVFENLINVFVEALLHYGVFISVDIFYLDDARLYRDKNLKIEVKNFSHFSQQNTLTLILSTCLSPAWKSNKMLLLIAQKLSKESFCAIVQMLPAHLWLLTPLGRGRQVSFKWGKESKLSNKNLKSDEDLYFTEENNSKLNLPILSFEPSSLFAWSSFASKNKRYMLSGMMYENIKERTIQQYDFTEEERLKAFLENSTQTAKLLASYMANLPISFDVARMIQEEAVPNSNITHLSEVFLGGIIERKEKEGRVDYIFRTKPKAYLKEFVSPHKAFELLQKFVSRKINASLSLSAFFANKQGLQSLDIDEDTLELMRLGIDIKKRMGGTDYDEAVALENQLDEEEEQEKITSITPKTKSFLMGSNDYDNEKPIHEVVINYDFEIAQYPVTFEEYDLYCEAKEEIDKPSDEGWGRGKRPVINVSWNDTQGYIKWLNEQTGENYRLPTEAEWEYACRAGTTTKWSFGDDESKLKEYAWYDDTDRKKTEPVGELKPNPWHLHDMHGNVWEWCEDWYIDNYKDTPRDGTANEKGKKEYKVLRGGSWDNFAYRTRSSVRVRIYPSVSNNNVGFRLLRTLP